MGATGRKRLGGVDTTKRSSTKKERSGVQQKGGKDESLTELPKKTLKQSPSRAERSVPRSTKSERGKRGGVEKKKSQKKGTAGASRRRTDNSSAFRQKNGSRKKTLDRRTINRSSSRKGAAEEERRQSRRGAGRKNGGNQKNLKFVLYRNCLKTKQNRPSVKM